MWVNSYGSSSDTVTGLAQVTTPTDVSVGVGSDGYWYVTANAVRITPPSLQLANIDAAVALSDKLLRVDTYTGYSNTGSSDTPTGSLWRTEVTQVGVVQEQVQAGVAGEWYVFANGSTSLRLIPPSQGWTTADPAWTWANDFVASGSDWWN